MDNKSKMGTFLGNVVARQEQEGKEPFIMECHKMIVYYTEEVGKKPPQAKGEKKKQEPENRIDRIVASGQVRIRQGKDVATGETATFFNADQRIILTGNPEVWQGKNLIKGEEITVWVKENRALVTSKGPKRVRAVIHQEEKK
jgi:lipopolysaccharide export system protein LptA